MLPEAMAQPHWCVLWWTEDLWGLNTHPHSGTMLFRVKSTPCPHWLLRLLVQTWLNLASKFFTIKKTGQTEDIFKENLGGIQTTLRQYQATKCFHKPLMGKMHGMLITIYKVTEIVIVPSLRKNENLNRGNPNHSNLKKYVFAACSKVSSQR